MIQRWKNIRRQQFAVFLRLQCCHLHSSRCSASRPKRAQDKILAILSSCAANQILDDCCRRGGSRTMILCGLIQISSATGSTRSSAAVFQRSVPVIEGRTIFVESSFETNSSIIHTSTFPVWSSAAGSGGAIMTFQPLAVGFCRARELLPISGSFITDEGSGASWLIENTIHMRRTLSRSKMWGFQQSAVQVTRVNFASCNGKLADSAFECGTGSGTGRASWLTVVDPFKLEWNSHVRLKSRQH